MLLWVDWQKLFSTNRTYKIPHKFPSNSDESLGLRRRLNVLYNSLKTPRKSVQNTSYKKYNNINSRGHKANSVRANENESELWKLPGPK